MYAPVVSLLTVRLGLGLVRFLDLDRHQTDVFTAFLNGNLEKKFFNEPPAELRDPRKPNLVSRVLKGLYALEQAPRR